MKVVLVGALVSFISGLAQPSPELQLDYNIAETTEATYVFHCEGRRAQLKFVEEFRPRSQVSRLADRWRIRLVELSVVGRSIPSDGAAEVARTLSRYSWLTLVNGRCADNGINIRIEGMPAEAWADFAEGRIDSRPSISGNQIDIAPNGEVTVR